VLKLGVVHLVEESLSNLSNEQLVGNQVSEDRPNRQLRYEEPDAPCVSYQVNDPKFSSLLDINIFDFVISPTGRRLILLLALSGS